MSAEIIILAGPNGAGKSTLAPFLLRDWLGLTEFVNADVIASGLSAFEPERAAFEAGRIMLGRLRELVAQNKSFAFETTLATRSYASWLRQLVSEDWHVNLVFIWLDSPALAVQRVAARVAAGGHSIPEATIRRRYDKGIRNFFALYQELAETWAVYDNSNSAQTVMLAKGQRKQAQIVFHEERWKRFSGAAK